MIAIETKYVGPTNTRGSRVSVTTCNGHRMMVEWDDALNSDENHTKAAAALADKMGWLSGVYGRMIGGGTKCGMVFVFTGHE